VSGPGAADSRPLTREELAAALRPLERAGDWMQTFSGAKFYPMDPAVEDIRGVDIAHSLALQCRYNGHVSRFYSVAEHCVHLSFAVAPKHALWALLHDASEAYVGDMIRPLKRHMPDYVDVEDSVQLAIAAWAGIRWPIPEAVLDADTRILLDERAALFPTSQRWAIDDTHQPLGVDIVGWSPAQAETRYLARMNELLVDRLFT
jgi:hypothetical protein